MVEEEILDPAAHTAHEMVMRGRRGIVVQRARTELRGDDLAALHEPLEVAIHRAEADRRQHAPDAIVDELRGRMLGPGRPDRLEHQRALRGGPATLTCALTHRAPTAAPPMLPPP